MPWILNIISTEKVISQRLIQKGPTSADNRPASVQLWNREDWKETLAFCLNVMDYSRYGKKGGRCIEVVPPSFLCTITCNYVKLGTQNEPYQDWQSVLIPPFTVAANYILLRIRYIMKTLQAILANYL